MPMPTLKAGRGANVVTTTERRQTGSVKQERRGGIIKQFAADPLFGLAEHDQLHLTLRDHEDDENDGAAHHEHCLGMVGNGRPLRPRHRFSPQEP